VQEVCFKELSGIEKLQLRLLIAAEAFISSRHKYVLIWGSHHLVTHFCSLAHPCVHSAFDFIICQRVAMCEYFEGSRSSEQIICCLFTP
jgi:hypothetical protein